MKDLLPQFRFEATGNAFLPRTQSERTVLNNAFASLPSDPYLPTARRQTGLLTARYTRIPGENWRRELLPQEPYVQRSDMSPVGSMERNYPSYEGVLVDTADQVFRGALDKFPDFFPRTMYDVDMFAFRITGEAGQPGSPAIEGGHYDGDERNLLFVVSRQNVAPETGVTTLFRYQKPDNPCFKKPLEPGDLVTWKDRRKRGLWHNTTPITPEDPTDLAIRHVFDFGINPAPVRERVVYRLKKTRSYLEI